MKLPNNPKVLAATYNPVSNTKMISFLVDFPTVLLAELRTHRILTQGSLYEHMELDDFNMSANSARAIPSNKYWDKVIKNPFIPIWTKQQKGMSGEIIENTEELDNVWKWVAFGDSAGGIDIAYSDLIQLGAHKQNANRLLAPFAWTTCILSGTEWDNFFELRCPKYSIVIDGVEYIGKSKKEISLLTDTSYENSTLDKCNISTAQPEFQVIAEILYDLYQEADWKESKYHIPFENYIRATWCLEPSSQASQLEVDEFYNTMMKISASMCAKLSYNTQDNEDTFEKHLERTNLLIEHKHQEPFSHQAVAMNKDEYMSFSRTKLVREEGNLVKETAYGNCYNLNGFISQRYILENY